jgi:hypothetical protein
MSTGLPTQRVSHSADPAETSAPVARGIGARLLHEAREALPPTLFFFVGFNFIVLTTNLILADYNEAAFNFMVATLSALVVGKAVLVANAIPYINRYDRAPLIRPILFKTAFYSIVVFLVRLLERFVHFTVVEHNRPRGFVSDAMSTFSWDRFLAINLWICILFLIYVTASEIAHLFGPKALWRLFFTSRPTELMLNRRQQIRELIHLSRLMDAHPFADFRDPANPAHGQLIDSLERLAR